MSLGFLRRRLFPGSPLLGIDLCGRQARLIACSPLRRSWRIDRCATVPLPRDSLKDDGHILAFEPLVRCLTQLVALAGGGRRIALAMPAQGGWQQVLQVPRTVRPWGWSGWVRAQAERLAGEPAQALAYEVQHLPGPELRVWLMVHLREQVQDWQGLAEAAGLDLVLLESRLRMLQLALSVAGPRGGSPLAVALADEDHCQVLRCGPGEAVEVWAQGSALDFAALDLGARAPDAAPAGGWLLGPDLASERWQAVLQARLGGAWMTHDLLSRVCWPDDAPRPDDAAAYAVALGLALRAWHP